MTDPSEEEKQFAKENESFCTNTYPNIGEGIMVGFVSTWDCSGNISGKK